MTERSEHAIEKVIDCSVTASWFLTDEKSNKGDELLEDILDGKVLFIVPTLWFMKRLIC